MALLAVTTLSAQNYSLERERQQAMKLEEEKISAYIEENMSREIPKEVYDLYSQYIEKEGHEGHDHAFELPPEEFKDIELGMKKLYLRALYFKEHPEANQLFQAVVLGPCLNGDLELGDYTGFGIESGLFGTGECTPAGITFVSETPGTLETPVVTDPGINCLVMNTGPDPIVSSYGGTLQQVHAGSHSIRVNQDHRRYGVQRLTFPVVLTQPNEDIAFWFSFVLQNPNGHSNDQPFFRASATHVSSGIEQDNFCETGNERNNFTTAAQVSGTDSIVWTEWRCGELEVAGNVGDTVMLEIVTSDCGQSGHWGYSYIDDICTVCIADSCNYQGSIDLDPTDTCSEITQICGSYDLAAFQCTTATVQSLTLDIYQGGIVINTLTSPTIDLINQTFCFPLSPGDFGALTGGFDFQANITFNINGSLNTESDLNTNPGPDNDYLTDPSCCPEFKILDCCTYWDLGSLRSAVAVDQKIVDAVAKYKSNLRAKYGSWIDTTSCNPCNFPNDLFPVFIVDENNMLIDDSYYDISWSHNPGWTAAYDWIYANQTTVVTVEDSLLGCTWTDTFYYDCCEFEAEIVPLCTTCDPCSNPNLPFLMIVNDQNGNPISTSGYSFVWSTGSTGSGISGSVNNTYWVTVTELATGCMSTDTFEINCCSCEINADFDFLISKCDVRFADKSTTNSCTQISGYSWDFGDGSTSTLANPSHTYAANGTYTVCLIVYGNDSLSQCSDTICKKVTIKDCDPCKCDLDPSFDVSIDKCVAKFEGKAGNNSCTQVLQYYWDFGDGANSNVQNPTHTYATNGFYTVCFTVEGFDGVDVCKATVCKVIEIRDCEDCPCELDPQIKYSIDKCEVRFDAAAGNNACTQVNKYFWDFGDGTTSTLQSPVHVYATNGSYTVCLTVEGDNGTVKCKKTVCEVIDIRNCEDCVCKVSSNFIGLFGIQDPCTVFFNESASTNSCTSITGYSWDFGDGTSSSSANPSHTFPGDGTYNVCLTVYGSNGVVGCKDTYCKKITISGCRVSSPTKSGSVSGNAVNDFAASVFPNPFNSTLSINFTNPTEQDVEVTLLDASGKQIGSIVNEAFAAGNHELSFNASELNLSQGVYFVVIRGQNYLSYKKVVFSK